MSSVIQVVQLSLSLLHVNVLPSEIATYHMINEISLWLFSLGGKLKKTRHHRCPSPQLSRE